MSSLLFRWQIRNSNFGFLVDKSGEVAAHDQHSARALHPGAARRHAAVPAAHESLQGWKKRDTTGFRTGVP